MFNERLREPERILIIDDSPSNARVVAEALRGQAEVHHASGERAALGMARSLKPDLILLDIAVPGRDSRAVYHALKAMPPLRDVPIICITGKDADDDQLQALGMDGADFLRQPLSVQETRARIQTHLTLQRKARLLERAAQDMSDMRRYFPVFIAYWNADLRNISCNDAEGCWFGLPAADMAGLHARDALGADNYRAMAEPLRQALAGSDALFESRFSRPDGEIWYGRVALISRGANVLMMSIADVTDDKRTQHALFDEKERARVTLNVLADAVIATDDDGRVTFLNPIAENLTGWQFDDALNQPVDMILLLRNSQGRALPSPTHLALAERRTVGMALDCELQQRDGGLLAVVGRAAPVMDHAGRPGGAVVVFHDVSEARAMAVRMTHLAYHDALTNLPNRILLQDRLLQALQQAEQSGERLGLLMLDLDHFQLINDSMGHAVGDQLLQLVALRLQQGLRPGDTVSRQGGDEFIILMPGLGSIEQAGMLSEKLRRLVAEPFQLGESRYDLSASVGISLYPDDSRDADELYRHADAALYHAKQQGRNHCRFFSGEIEEALLTRQALERHFRMGAEQESFLVYYQPKVDVEDLSTVGVEALMRWRKEDGAILAPAEFIPLAEKTGLILPLGQLVLRQACLDGKRWHDAGCDLHVAVNVSAMQIAAAGFCEQLRATLKETGMAPDRLQLELTESVLARDVELTMAMLSELKSLGVSIAIDDFGTGYSSLSYLKSFPIDVLKIDQSFVRDMLSDSSSGAIVAAIVRMAQAMGLSLVAEGVESAEQAHALARQGVRIMQGFYYGKPMPVEEMDRRLS